MKLNEPCFRPFPLGAIAPRGWLAQQLRIQADGLSGHLDEFWPDIQESAWIGGEAEGWERMPYWLDGVIPLAWLLDDVPLKSRINSYMAYIIRHQQEDGWLGPRIEDKAEAKDLWSQALALKVLVVYYDATQDARIPPVVEKALRGLDRHIDTNPLSTWGQFRWFETLIAIWWLFERSQDVWLLELAVKLQAQGFHWQDFFSAWPLSDPTPKGRWNYAGHVVNNAMMLKAGALWWRFTGQEKDRNAVYEMFDQLDTFHGTVTGLFTGDECLAGKSPTQGTELCAVVEEMYSLECLVGLLGDPAFADKLEKIAFNALPATFSPDMWSHQYVQQVNQIECSVREDRPWTTNDADANIFGLEPHFGCCTANLSQGWPKFAAHLWMQTANEDIVALVYAPSQLKTTVAGIAVSVELETDYPFGEKLKFSIIVDEPVTFSLFLRIPGWVQETFLEIEKDTSKISAPGTFHEIRREWYGTTEVRLTLPMQIRIEQRPNNTISLLRGPLVYALKIDEEWRRINQELPYRELPHGDWEVYPTSPWNYALEVDEKSIDLFTPDQKLGDCPFSPDGAPLSIRVRGRRLTEWGAENGSVRTPPPNRSKFGPEEDLLLIPYGCTNLRIAEFPIVATDKDAE